jgi:tellurite resistance protein
MQLERAMMIAQQRNNLHTQGTTLDTHSSFYAFSDEDIISRAKTLGISMGSNSKSERAAAQLIKENEKKRVLTFLKNDKTLEEEATLPPCIVVSRASDLCEDLDDFSDENLDEHIDSLISHSVAKPKRKKKSYDKTYVRRSDRLRIKRINKKQS